MGNDRGRPDEQPAHDVTLRPFLAALEPVSNREYAVFLTATGHPPPPFIDDPRFGAPGQPAVGISWFDASAYCDWIRAETGAAARLPTEAERECAARGGLAGQAWPWGEAPPASIGALRPVADLAHPHVPSASCENGYGLRCMAENVHEWCSDWYDKDYYRDSPPANPDGPDQGARKASRGGAWRHRVKFTPVAARSSLVPTFQYNDYGFRVYADA